jgi:hypothetical protein
VWMQCIERLGESLLSLLNNDIHSQLLMIVALNSEDVDSHIKC